MTSLGRLAAGCVEAAWLLLAVAAPLLFQATASRPFDLPKARLALALAPWIAAAAAVALVPRAAADSRRRIRAAAAREAVVTGVGPGRKLLEPRVLPLVAAGSVLLSYAVSTALSVAPLTSLWGSRFNAEGLLTGATYALLFAAVAASARRPDQVRRLVDLLLLASVPVALYGLAQYLDLDPLAPARTTPLPQGRVVSSLGNPILAGGCAAFVLPLALARLIEALRRTRSAAPPGTAPPPERTAPPASGHRVPVRRTGYPSEGPGTRPKDGWGVPGTRPAPGEAARLAGVVLLQTGGLALYLAAASQDEALWWAAPLVPVAWLALALAALPVRTGPRLAAAGYGSLIALHVGLLWATRSRGPLVGAAVGATLTLLLLWPVPARRRATVVLAAALITLLATAGLTVARNPTELTGAGGVFAQRWVIWGVVLELVAGRHPVGLEPDPAAAFRPLVGFGPETLAVAYDAVASPEARRAVPYRVTRAHNEPLEVLATRGILGLGSWVGLLAAAAMAVRCELAGRRDAGDQAGRLRAEVSGGAGALAAYVVHHLVEQNDPGLALGFWVVAGLVCSPAAQATALTAQAPPTPRSAGRRAAIVGLVLVGAAAAALALARGSAAPRAVVLAAALALALIGLAALLPHAGERSTARLPWRRAALAVSLVPAAFLLSVVPLRRLEAGVYSKYSLATADRGDLAGAFALGRIALVLAPEDELLHSNFARVLAPIANRAPDGLLRPDVPRSVEQLLAWRRPVGEINKREAIALAQVVLERAVELAPLEHENRLALEIVHRALADLGEPGHRERADEQLRLRRRLRPAGDVG